MCINDDIPSIFYKQTLQSTIKMLEVILIVAAIVLLALFIKSLIKSNVKIETKQVDVKVEQKKLSFGRIRIYYGTQTGTAAKMAENFAEEASQNGFQPEVIDLKNIEFQHLNSINEISIFFIANTGEGLPPDNTVRFMQILKGKEDFGSDKIINWGQINFAVFGLGNTQYEHYNKTGIDCDILLDKNGCNRLFKLGLGDDNSSMEDDYAEWKRSIWETLKQFRNNNELISQPSFPLPRKISSESSIKEVSVKSVSKQAPIYANFKLYYSNQYQSAQINKDEIELDFKTKASLKSSIGTLHNIKQVRQNVKDGSTIEFEVELEKSPRYQTAGNIALYPTNDPNIVNQVAKYFHLTQSDLQRKVGVQPINSEKKLKLNFIPNQSLKQIIEQSIDLQGKLTKSTLKKLGKFKSINPSYFVQNSAIKSTDEYKRLSEEGQNGQFHYLFKLITEFEVQLTLQDFIELSDSIAPRLFTIASYYQCQRNVVVAASIVQNGLISKNFMSNPKLIKAELRKSTFTDAMKWKKVIFISAGTGFAPFRGYLQQKQHRMKLNKEGANLNIPLVTLYFGCKHQTGDFIYKQEILRWQKEGVINRAQFAFSRDTQKKIYVQNLLQREEQELNQYFESEDEAIYICGSLGMGSSINSILIQKRNIEVVKKLEESGRLVRELW